MLVHRTAAAALLAVVFARAAGAQHPRNPALPTPFHPACFLVGNVRPPLDELRSQLPFDMRLDLRLDAETGQVAHVLSTSDPLYRSYFPSRWSPLGRDSVMLFWFDRGRNRAVGIQAAITGDSLMGRAAVLRWEADGFSSESALVFVLRAARIACEHRAWHFAGMPLWLR
ncbi:MAG TPA: hypothetical protein VFQ38_08930 [Longimicrobiales bacterium]|nr:hypothetical protein [Longimicrobiales bacterium]